MSEPNFNLTSQDGPDQTDPRLIHWPSRQSRALVPFELDAEGLPVNPVQPELPAGRNSLWHWGEAIAVDALVFHIDTYGTRRLLMVERGDGHGWALPGGMLDPNETPLTAVARELAEETGLPIPEERFYLSDPRYMPDPRAGRNAWMVGIPGTATLRSHNLPNVSGRDDANDATWLPADSYAVLETAITLLGGVVFPAHRDLLAERLG